MVFVRKRKHTTPVKPEKRGPAECCLNNKIVTFWQNSDSEEKGTNFHQLVFVNTLRSKAGVPFWLLYSCLQ